MKLQIQANDLKEMTFTMNNFLKGVRKIEKDITILSNPNEDWEKPEEFFNSAKKIIFSVIDTNTQNFKNDLITELNKYIPSEFDKIYCRICGKDYTIIMTDEIKEILVKKYPQKETLVTIKYMGLGFKIFLMLIKK